MLLNTVTPTEGLQEAVKQPVAYAASWLTRYDVKGYGLKWELHVYKWRMFPTVLYSSISVM